MMNAQPKSNGEQRVCGPVVSRMEPAGEGRNCARGEVDTRLVLVSLALAACGGGDPLFDATDAATPQAADDVPTKSALNAAGAAAGIEVAHGWRPRKATEASKPGASPSGLPDVGDEPAASSPLLPKCVTKDSQVLLIGDSYINWFSHSFPADLARISGQNWRLEAIGGTSMATGGIGLIGLGFIPDQLDRAMAVDPDAHTIVMDGGGNDILIRDAAYAPNSCTTAGSSRDPGCQRVVSLAVEAAKNLMLEAASRGIRDIVYFFYPHVPAFTFLTQDEPNEILDYALPQAKALCEDAEEATGGSLRCRFVDMVPVFEGHPEYINEDIHPNALGGRVMAEKIWEVMEEHCLGQEGIHDCCEP
jgi:lysophospholipase L1-like esterase